MPSIGELTGTVTLEDKFSGTMDQLAKNADKSIGAMTDGFKKWEQQSQKQFDGFRVLTLSGVKDLANFRTEAVKVGEDFEKMRSKLNGDDIVRQASMIALAVRDIGGASKLTEAELAKLLPTVKAAAEKLMLMGKEVPPALQNIISAEKEVTKTTEAWYSGILQTAAGFALWDIAKSALSGVVGVVKDLAHWTGELVSRGGTYGDIAGNFEQLASSAGKVSSELLGAMADGTQHTITNFELMKVINSDLAAGLNLTSAQFGILAKGATALAKSTGTDTADALEKMNRAMLTGQTIGISSMVGKLDLEKAEKAYADSIDKTRDQLTEAMKLEARREAILNAVSEATERAGAQNSDLNDILAQVQTAWQNLTDKVGAAIAQNPVLIAGATAVRDALLGAFGSNQKDLVTGINNAVSQLALKIPDLIDTIIQLGVEAAKVLDDIERRAGSMGNAVRHIAVGAAAGATMGSFAAGVGAVPGALIGGVVGAMAPFSNKDTGQASEGLKAVEAGAKRAMEATALMRQRMKEAAATANDLGAATAGAGKGVKELGIGADLTTDKLSKAEKAAQKHTDAVKQMELTLGGERKSFELTYEAIRQMISEGPMEDEVATNVVNALDKIHKAHGNIPADLEAWRLQNQTLGDSYDKLADKVAKVNAGVREGVTLGSNASVMTGGNLGKGGFLGADIKQLEKTMAELAKITPAVGYLANSPNKQTSSNIAETLGSVGSIAPTLGKLKEEIRHLEAASTSTEAAFQNLAGMFTQLGQLAGGTLGSVLKGVGGILVSLDAARKSNRLYSGADLGVASGLFAKTHADGSPITGGEKWSAAAASAAAIGQGAMNIWNAAGQYDSKKSGAANRMMNAGNAAMQGAEAGAAFGPWGMAIGAAAGLVVGLVRGKPAWAKAADEVGKDFGTKISDALAHTIADDAKDKFNGSRQASSLFHLNDIIKEAGGLNSANLGQMTSRLHDVFSMVATGQMKVADAQKVVNDTFAQFVDASTDSYGMLSSKMKEIIKLDKQYGTNSQAVKDYIKQQTDVAIKGSNDVIASIQTESAQWQDLADNIKANADAITDAKKKHTDFSEITKTQNTLLKTQADLATQNKQRLEDMGTIAVATFGAALEAGATFSEALMKAGPSLATLGDAFKNLGIDTDNEVLKLLMMQGTILKNNPSLIQAISGLGSALAAQSNISKLNASDLQAFERTGYDMYVRMQGEVAKLGGGTREALLPMQTYLHQAAEAAAELGIPLDDNTQMLIDQSKELGIWKDKGKSASEKLQDSFDKLSDKLQGFINKLLGIPDVDTTVTTHYETDGAPPDIGGGPNNGEGDTAPGGWRNDQPAQTEALGGFGRATGPMTFKTNGGEDWAFSGEGNSFKDLIEQALTNKGMSGGGIVINNKFDMSGVLNEADFAALVETKAIPVLVRQIQNNTNGVRTTMKEDLGVS